MDTRLTRPARAELTRSLRRRYQAATSPAKKQILAEFIAVTGYHPKYALHVLNASEPAASGPRGRARPLLYDEAAKQALIVLWEASDRVCGKRLKPLLKILLPALERHGHLKLEDALRAKLLAMSAATIDRLLRAPRQTGRKKRRRVVPEIRRRVPVRTFADWHEPPPGSMEMDLVAHCGESTRGSYIHSLVVTDIASGWTESAPLVVRERTLLVETLDRIRLGLPFPLRALDVDNGSEFMNETMIEYCLRHGIELTRSRPYRKNDQAWIEQKNGAVVRGLLGYRRFEGIAAAQVFARLYGTSRLFVNFFQPSFKLAEKHRQGAQVTKRYLPPETPCERLLQAPTISEATKCKLREVAGGLDPLQLLEEIRALQSHLVALADGGPPDACTPPAANLAEFLASLSGAWRAGEVRPTHAVEPRPRYLRQIQTIVRRDRGVDSRPIRSTKRTSFLAYTSPRSVHNHRQSTRGTPVRSGDRSPVRASASGVCETKYSQAARVRARVATCLPSTRGSSEHERNGTVRRATSSIPWTVASRSASRLRTASAAVARGCSRPWNRNRLPAIPAFVETAHSSPARSAGSDLAGDPSAAGVGPGPDCA
jgi:hypothetical protein